MRILKYSLLCLFFLSAGSIFGQNDSNFTYRRDSVAMVKFLDSARIKWRYKLPACDVPVTDAASVFTDSQKLVLVNLIREIFAQTNFELDVVILPYSSITKEEFDDFTLYASTRWKHFDTASKGNSIFFISPSLHKLRIQNNKNIQRFITDIETKQVIDNTMIPYLKTNDYFTATYFGLLDFSKRLKQ